MSIQTLSTFLNVFYIGALVIGAASSAGLVYCNNRLQRDANLKIAQANESAALAEQRAEELTNENLEIKKKMAWRTLEGEDRKSFIDAIQTPSDEHHVIVIRLQDGESWNYSGQILSAFTTAVGWIRTEGSKHLYGSGEIPQGVICRVSANPDAVIERTIHALEKANVNPIVKREPNLPANTIEITVGLKPVG